MTSDFFQSCGHCWVFQICWHIECSSLIAWSFRILNSSARIPSPPLALLVAVLPKAHLTSHSTMSGSESETTPSWLSQSWRPFLYSFSVCSHHLFLISFYYAAKSLQSCPTLCGPIDGSPPGSPIPGILQARTLEWVAISFSNAGKWKVKVKSFSHVRLLATPWTAAYQAPLSMGLSRQEYWSGVPLPSPLLMLGICYFCPLLCPSLHEIFPWYLCFLGWDL